MTAKTGLGHYTYTSLKLIGENNSECNKTSQYLSPIDLGSFIDIVKRVLTRGGVTLEPERRVIKLPRVSETK
ncbi:hypothetical protein TNCT_138261 [Trichonephila clavata]|uniref:Uncharacterized protein n=1 Tax=Trichonephila clavata TaxID=2740835 RepID=A0A8X6G7V8_TRICU|nr:hypothetical protein TNCT_138261 [Trichonephila clavata]